METVGCPGFRPCQFGMAQSDAAGLRRLAPPARSRPVTASAVAMPA
jgi:hypothetical protein